MEPVARKMYSFARMRDESTLTPTIRTPSAQWLECMVYPKAARCQLPTLARVPAGNAIAGPLMTKSARLGMVVGYR